MTVGQVRSQVEATVSLEFEAWGRLQATLASGSQQTNLLLTVAGAAPNGSGGVAAAPVPLLTGAGPASTATSLNVGAAAAAGFSVGSLVAVDVDYTGQLGYIGAGVSAAYVQSAAAVGWRHELCSASDSERGRGGGDREWRACSLRIRCRRAFRLRACR